MINGTARQVMLAGRELAPEKNPLANSWVNQRITFTHGIGVAMVPVNAATPEGQPDLFIQDLPPVSTSGAPQITQPRIYFGERPSDWIIVGARQDEFDYPVGDRTRPSSVDSNATTRWTGHHRRSSSTRPSRACSGRSSYKDLNLLISDQITDQSQLLIHRSISDRISMVAPFLTLRQRSVPGGQQRRRPRLHPGRLHDQRPVPERPAGRLPSQLPPGSALPGSTSTTSATASRSSSTPTPAR